MGSHSHTWCSRHYVLLLVSLKVHLALVDVVALDLVNVLRHLNRDVSSLASSVADTIHHGVSIDLAGIVFKLIHHGSERSRANCLISGEVLV